METTTRSKMMNLVHHDVDASRMKSTWELEEAFMEDASKLLFTWPPRSYSCSFCGKEFRSAQALGGHMNVHRRDRAKLNQNPIIYSPYHSPTLNPSNMCEDDHDGILINSSNEENSDIKHKISVSESEGNGNVHQCHNISRKRGRSHDHQLLFSSCSRNGIELEETDLDLELRLGVCEKRKN